MKKTYFIFITLIIALIACEKNEDRIFLTKRLVLEAKINDSWNLIFSWNENINLKDGYYILISTYESKPEEYYEEIADSYLKDNSNRGYYRGTRIFPEGKNSYVLYADNYHYNILQKYYKLLIYNSLGEYLLSNTVNIELLF